MSNTVLTKRKEGVLTITMNRPEALNALDRELSETLQKTILIAEQDKKVRCVVIRGGEQFMAGGDLKYFSENLNINPNEKRIMFEGFINQVHKIIISIRHMPKPVVASIRGPAAGFGLSLAMACDLAIASDDAFFTLAYVNIGTSPDGGSTFALPRILGDKKAAEIAFLGDRFSAAAAKEFGIVNWVVAGTDLETETSKLAKRLAEAPTTAIGRTKALLRQSLHTTLENQLQAEAESFSSCAVEPDFNEGISAFIAKRKPKFKG
jgi:2-(1,2-epoxy-1,2-dihydrophenyl)acetyl-CoA isomerase